MSLSLFTAHLPQDYDQEHTARPENAHSHAQFHSLPRPLSIDEQDRLAHLDRLKFFLATAPSHWDPASSTSASIDPSDPAFQSHPHPHPNLHRFPLPNNEHVTCVLWNGLFHITGTDIVRALTFRFEAFGRPVRNVKKFEEGVFSDLRNLKPGVDACLEEPKVLSYSFPSF